MVRINIVYSGTCSVGVDIRAALMSTKQALSPLDGTNRDRKIVHDSDYILFFPKNYY
jgi:hypothetical protein